MKRNKKLYSQLPLKSVQQISDQRTGSFYCIRAQRLHALIVCTHDLGKICHNLGLGFTSKPSSCKRNQFITATLNNEQLYSLKALSNLKHSPFLLLVESMLMVLNVCNYVLVDSADESSFHCF